MCIGLQPLGREVAASCCTEQVLNGGEPIDLARSLYVGDAAGREGDFSSSDRDFAANNRRGISLYRTERFPNDVAPAINMAHSRSVSAVGAGDERK